MTSIKSGIRLDKYLLTKMPGQTRSQIYNAVKNGDITVNGVKVKAGYILREDDIISGEIPDKVVPAIPEKMDIDIVYEDEYLIAVNKPRGLVVHPGAGVKKGTLLNGLLGLGITAERGGIVHRLDKNTAGLLLAAKDGLTQALLAKMFEKHKVKRTYIGICEGKIDGDMTINKNIIRDPKHRTLFTAAEAGGRNAITHLKVLEKYNKYTLCEFNLETGRTHQIRVHCKSIGHPLLGDPEYNPKGGSGQMLDAVKLELIHPITHKLLQVEISPTKELTNAKLKCIYYK